MNHRQPVTWPARYRKGALGALVLLLSVSGGCGKNKVVTPPPGPQVVVEPNQKLPTAPHRFDVYRPENADKAIVCLHGGTGTKEGFANQLGIKRDSSTSNFALANEQILVDNHAIAVFPQGQAIAIAPTAYTWNNYVMNSGQNDMQFIQDLVGYIKSTYGVSRVYVVGHSNGGMMASRIWCEVPDLFDAYVAIAGPPSEYFLDAQTPCSPTVAKPFLSIVGSQDDVLQDYDWEAQTWTINPVLAASPAFVDPTLAGERYFLPIRVSERCGETVQPGDTDAVKNSRTATWSFCGGSIKLIRVEAAGHLVQSLEAGSGRTMLGLIFEFIDLQ